MTDFDNVITRHRTGMCVCICVCGRVAEYYPLVLTNPMLQVKTQCCELKPSIYRKIFLFFNIFYPHSPPSCDGDVEFFRVQIQWPCQSAKGPGGTLGDHTHKLRALVSPASSKPGSRSLLALAYSAC